MAKPRKEAASELLHIDDAMARLARLAGALYGAAIGLKDESDGPIAQGVLHLSNQLETDASELRDRIAACRKLLGKETADA